MGRAFSGLTLFLSQGHSIPPFPTTPLYSMPISHPNPFLNCAWVTPRDHNKTPFPKRLRVLLYPGILFFLSFHRGWISTHDWEALPLLSLATCPIGVPAMACPIEKFQAPPLIPSVFSLPGVVVALLALAATPTTVASCAVSPTAPQRHLFP
jgi:hypothetical protein